MVGHQYNLGPLLRSVERRSTCARRSAAYAPLTDQQLIVSVPQSYQDEVVERASRLLSKQSDDKPIEELLEPRESDQ